MDLQRWTSSGAQSEPELFGWSTMLPAALWREVLGDVSFSLSITIDGSFRVCADRGPDGAEVLFEGTGDTHLPCVPIGSAELVWIDAEDLRCVHEVVWSSDLAVEIPGVIAVVPTFRRDSDATHQAATFLRSELVHRVVVIDQGRTVAEHPPFRELQDEHPERLVLIEQGNFGGSGGYARGMIESLSYSDCAVLLSDDDAALPEESLRRMLVAQAFASRAGRPMIMATPMFSAEDSSTLISAAEYVNPRVFQWGAADGVREPVKVDGPRLRLSSELKLRHVPSYAGWWGALLPPGTVAEIGLPAPYFLKWDDAEYGLRATGAGYRVMALPGTGVWHPTWGAHKTLTTWVAVLLHRNRLATAAAHGAGRGVIRDSFAHQVKHVLSLQYDVADLWAAGIDQFLFGTEWLGSDLADARSKAQAVVDSLPKTPVAGLIPPQAPQLNIANGLADAILGLLRSGTRRESSCPAASFTWRDGLGMDRVVLTDGDEAIAEFVRDPVRARSILWKSVRQHTALARTWRSVRLRYGEALPRSVTLARWVDMLGIRL